MAEEVAEIFSKHIFSSKYEDLSEKTIKQLKVFLLDTIGVGIAGSTIIGNNVVIQDGCKIGIKGFGFIPKQDKISVSPILVELF